MLWDDGTVATQPNLPYNNALVASTVTPTKELHHLNLDEATSDLSEDEYSTVTSNIPEDEYSTVTSNIRDYQFSLG
jgi:hypothetical protein